MFRPRTPIPAITLNHLSSSAGASGLSRFLGSMNPVLSEKDKAYVRSEFISLSELCGSQGRDVRTTLSEIRDRFRPRPSYVFEDGTEFVPADYFAQEIRQDRFFERLRIRSEAFGYPLSLTDYKAIWNDYLDGTYGKCLVRVSPESIVEKGYLIDRISALIAEPQASEQGWRRALGAYVDALDAIERPFCDHDRAGAGGAVSRDTFVDGVRAKFGV
jgi:hypothetical protein